MSLPLNTLSSVGVPAAFLVPKNRTKEALVDYFLGGNGIGDASAGLATQTWQATVDSTGLIVQYFSPLSGLVSVLTVLQPIVWLSAAFDQSMRPLIAWIDSTGAAYWYWYNTIVPGFVTSAFPAGTVTPYATLDETRSIESNISDGLITYITAGGNLCYRQQRDRFGIEYTLTAVPAPSPIFGPIQLTQVGMTTGLRMQYQFQYPGLALTAWPPVLLSNLVGAIPRIWPLEDDVTARSNSVRIKP